MEERQVIRPEDVGSLEDVLGKNDPLFRDDCKDAMKKDKEKAEQDPGPFQCVRCIELERELKYLVKILEQHAGSNFFTETLGAISTAKRILRGESR